MKTLICFWAVGSLAFSFGVATASAQQYSAVDLYTLEGTPTYFTNFIDVNSVVAGQIVGDSGFVGPVFYEAVMWNGLSGAITGLSPTGSFGFSSANATDGVHQVGFAYGPQGDNSHAVLWNGAADAVVDLHPTKLPDIATSEALGLGGGQQVGLISTWYTPEYGHAALWRGTPTRWWIYIQRI